MLNHRKNLSKIAILTFVITFLFLALAPLAAFAQGGTSTYSSETLNNSSDPMEGVKINDTGIGVPTVELPDVHIGEAKEFVERKGFDVVGLLQTFAQPFSIVLFIFGAFLALLGAFGKTSGTLKGLLVMGVAVLIYAAVLSAPELMDFGNAWLKS